MIDFRLTARRDAKAARAFLRQARETVRLYHPLTIVTDKAHSNGAFEVLEGPDIEGAVILEYPGMLAARDWYFSPAYQEVVQHRFKGAKYRGYILEGG